MSWTLRSVSTFSAVLGPLFLLPFGRPLGRFGVGGPTGSCGERSSMEPITNQRKKNAFFPDYLMMMSVKCRVVQIHKILLYLLLFPWPPPAPALRLGRWLGGAWLGRRLFGPTVTHACVCPPASKSVGIKAWSSSLGGLKSRGPEYQELKKMGGKKMLLLNIIVSQNWSW